MNPHEARCILAGCLRALRGCQHVSSFSNPVGRCRVDSVHRVLMKEWLPLSYHFNQCVILALGLWAIVHRESVIQVELVSARLSWRILSRCYFSVDADKISLNHSGLGGDRHVFSNCKKQ